MWKNILTTACLLFALAGQAWGQTAAECFKSMPDSLTPLLTPVNKADFIDFLASNMKANVANRFGKNSEMTHLSDDYVRIRMTAQSSWQMKLLPLSDSTKVACIVSTVYAPAGDSEIHFYASNWESLPTDSFLALPRLTDYLALPDTLRDNKVRDLARQADMLLQVADLSARGDTLTFTFTTPDYMDAEAVQTLSPYIRKTRQLVWQGGKFQPVD